MERIVIHPEHYDSSATELRQRIIRSIEMSGQKANNELDVISKDVPWEGPPPLSPLLAPYEELLFSSGCNYILKLAPLSRKEKAFKLALNSLLLGKLILSICESVGLPFLECKLLPGMLHITTHRLLFCPWHTRRTPISLLYREICSCKHVGKLFGFSPSLVVQTATRQERFIIGGADALAPFIVEQLSSRGNGGTGHS
jgi:hypothetical protein